MSKATNKAIFLVSQSCGHFSSNASAGVSTKTSMVVCCQNVWTQGVKSCRVSCNGLSSSVASGWVVLI
eukprot:825763-Amphidinium_carterae.2